jgi:hypothetical protein
MPLIFDFWTSHYGFPGSQEQETHPGSQERRTHPGSGFRVLGNGEPIVDFAFPVLMNGVPACVPVPGNPQPATRLRPPFPRTRNPLAFPVPGNGTRNWHPYQELKTLPKFLPFTVRKRVPHAWEPIVTCLKTKIETMSKNPTMFRNAQK